MEQISVKQRAWYLKRGAILLLARESGAMACAACGASWSASVREGGSFHRGSWTCQTCGANTKSKLTVGEALAAMATDEKPEGEVMEAPAVVGTPEDRLNGLREAYETFRNSEDHANMAPGKRRRFTRTAERAIRLIEAFMAMEP
jgi:hypothetical protein